MWYLKGVIENNLEQRNKENQENYFINHINLNIMRLTDKRDIEPNTKKVEDKI